MLVNGLLAAVLLEDCRSDPRASTSGQPEALQPVRIGYFANLTHAQAILGVASGEFAKAIAPAQLDTKVFNAGPSLMEALLAGEIDVGYVGPGPALNAYTRTRGQGVRIVAGAAANGVVIVARDGSSIRKMEDLKGKRIATPQLGNTQDISARHYLTAVLGQADTDNVLPIANAEQSSLMTRGEIDAAWVPEPWGARLVAEAHGRIVGEEKDLWPSGRFGLTLVVTTPEFLAGRRDAMRQVLAVHHSWTQRLAADPRRYVPDLSAALASLTGKPMAESLLADAILRVTFDDDPLEESLVTIARWSHELHYMKDPPQVDGMVDRSLLSPPAAGQ